MSGRLSHVVLVGRDTALWLGAATLAHALGPAGLRVTAIELPSQLGLASLHVTMPALEALHARLGIDEGELLRLTGGSFTLGTSIEGFGPGAPFFLAHGAYGAPIAGADFFGCWLKARAHGLSAAFEDFSLTAAAARQGRLLLPDERTEAFGRADYAYHLPAIPYAALLKARAARLGVAVVQTRSVAIEAEGGTIRSVRPEGGEPIAGELFVDASGADALLAGDALGVRHESWRPFFPHDRRLVARGSRFATTPVYTALRAAGGGWVSLAGTPGATTVAHAWASGEAADEQALARAAAAARLPLSDARVSAVEPGIRDAWTGNCIALGAAACTFDPLFDPELHAIQQGLVHLLALFPAGVEHAAERAEYNRVTRALGERVRDVQRALTATGGGAIPPSLAHTLATFRARGIVPPMEGESFAPDLWRALLVGVGVVPESWPPAIDRVPPETLRAEFRRILSFVRETVLAQPTHDATLAGLLGGEAA